MNGREGIDMAKMAVSVLLCSLLVGTVITFFYVFVTIGNKSYGDTKQKVETVNMEKLYTMQDQFYYDVCLRQVQVYIHFSHARLRRRLSCLY